MDKTIEFRWPQKLSKFGIKNPFLKILVSKYENEIPWQSGVRNEPDLMAFVSGQMLPRQLERISYPPKPGVKHCYVYIHHINLDSALNAEDHFDEEEIESIERIREEHGDKAAQTALARLINTQKAAAFKEWVDLLTTKYAAQDSAFCVLLLRPLLEMSGASDRRVILPPSPDVIDWLYRKIQKCRLSPNENVASFYARRLAAGFQQITENGWQYIPAGIVNAPKLAAASKGSGWCVQSSNWAARYLRNSCFFILRDQSRPVVALRTSPDALTVVECQGRSNNSPTEWFVDIDLFIRTQGIRLQSRMAEYAEALAVAGNPDEQTAGWWLERAKYWPPALLLAPKEKYLGEPKPGLSRMAPYLRFPRIQSFLDRLVSGLEKTDWTDLVDADPSLYSIVPAEFRNDEPILSACRNGFLERAQDGEITPTDLKALPDFVKEDSDFIAALEENFSADLRNQIRRPPRNATERLSRFKLGAEVACSSNDPFVLAVEHALSALLTNETPDFSDQVFPDALRERGDFFDVREKAWTEAVSAHSPLWFALAEDLKFKPTFLPIEGEVARVDLDAWEKKVKANPWLLTQTNGVPQSIRHHARILEAYLQGWLPYFEAAPWQIWVTRGRHRRVYASYGILREPRVFQALVKGWRAHLYWSASSERMRRMPLLQLAALCSLRHGLRAASMSDQELEACRDIAKLQNHSLKNDALSPQEKEIRILLQSMGFEVGWSLDAD